MPDCAIFADTRWEPPSIYTHPEGLSKQLSFPLYVVDNGRSPICIPCGCPSPRRSCWMRQTWERATRETGSATSARVTVASERRGSPLTPPRQSGMIIVTDKLARRCYQHPGPRRHLNGQVMQVALYY